jgi:Gas vesicle synthesis protein GvpL/GvpF
MSEPAPGRYAYCVIAAGTGSRVALDGIAGVDPRFGVEVLDHDRLSALVSPVPLEEFGAAALKRNLEDLDWLERTARAHQAVLDRALAAEAVVPLRLCTIFEQEEHVRDMLDGEGERLLEALEHVRGRAEWSVKVVADAATLEAAARDRSPELAALAADASGESPGRAYVARKKLERVVQEEAHSLAESAVAEIDSRLRERAVAATLLPAQHPDLAARPGEMLLNGAYLVERAGEAAFASLARELVDRHGDLGFEPRISGPWAPYDFVVAGWAP